MGMVAWHGGRCPKIRLTMLDLHSASPVEATNTTWPFGEAATTADDLPRPRGTPQLVQSNCLLCMMIDHATRFMVAVEVADLTGKTTTRVLRQHWVSIFQAPEAVLTDRGPAFRDSEFEEYVTQELCAYHVFTSPYYPQGNGINESSHRGLEASIAAAAGTLDVPFDEALRDAVVVHNATLHSALGDSPFFTMFGFDATLPGWQRYRPDKDEVWRSATRRELRHRAMIRAQLLEGRMKLEEKEDFAVGDIVVYILSEYERKHDRPSASTSDAYTPRWSLPSRVVEVNPHTVMCQPFGCP